MFHVKHLYQFGIFTCVHIRLMWVHHLGDSATLLSTSRSCLCDASVKDILKGIDHYYFGNSLSLFKLKHFHSFYMLFLPVAHHL